LKKEGEAGRRKITQYTRYGTVALALFQGLGIAIALESQAGLVLDPGPLFRFVTVLTLLTGTMFLMWVGEQITERGLGQRHFDHHLRRHRRRVCRVRWAVLFELVRTGAMHAISALFICALVVLVTGFVVFVEKGQRKILVNYAKRQVGNKIYGGQSSHLPLKLNMSGVIPPIFRLVHHSLSSHRRRLVRLGRGHDLAQGHRRDPVARPAHLRHSLRRRDRILLLLLHRPGVQLQGNRGQPEEERGLRARGYVPGDQTSRYIDKILTRLTLVGAVYITLVCLIPEFLILKWNVPFYFGGTSLLIIVVVTMDFMSQVQAYVMSHQYESLLKKANFKGAGFPGR
jgi:preprotein translocase subunit SecY